MENKIRILGALLVLQLLLAAIVLMGGKEYQAFEASEPLLALDVGKIDKIGIAQATGDDDAETKAVTLERKEGKWVLPELDDFPAADHGVDNLLSKLAAMKRSWPVAETDAAAERFAVASDRYKRRIQLFGKDQEPITLYLGTSPGFRKVHARVDGEKPIYAVAFNNYEAGIKSGDWVDSKQLEVKPAEVKRIELPDLTLVRDGDKLQPEGLAEGETAVSEAIEKLVEQVAGISIQTALVAEERPEYNLDNPLLRFSVTLKSGEQRDYTVSKLENSADYLLRSSAHDHYFKVASWAIDPIRQATREKLVNPPAADTTTETTDSEEAPTL